MNTATLTSPDWTDRKLPLWSLGLVVPLLPFIAWGLVEMTGMGAFWWFAPVFFYAIVPLLDWLVGDDASNPPESAVEQLDGRWYYRAVTFLYIPLQYAGTAFGAYMAVSGGLSFVEIIGLVFAVGIVNGVGINTAHELGHKKEKLERWLAKLTLAPVAYGHFYVEHNRGHHVRVATPEDPASSRMGETFWQFLPRSMIGSLRSAWELEAKRLQRDGKRVWSLDNDNLQAWAMTVVLFGAIVAVLGVGTLPFLLLQAAFGASLLEVINYIEHYGLLRQKGADGRYERCQPKHSWNSNHIVTNLFLYQLQRHSDHHANPTRRFQALRHFDESPQLPSGYASMLIPAYIPWLWFRQMDPLVVAHHKGDLGKANLYPPKREALLRRWHNAPLDDGRPALFPGGHGPLPAPAAPAAARYQCTDCGYVYDEARGCPHEGFAPGTRWAQIPETWACPDCAVREKPDFVALAPTAERA